MLGFFFKFILSVFFKTMSLNYCLVKNQKTKAAHINAVAWKWNKMGMVGSRDGGGAPAGTSLGTQRLWGAFHLQGLEQLSGGYRLWFGISTSLDFHISYGAAPQAHTGSLSRSPVIHKGQGYSVAGTCSLDRWVQILQGIPRLESWGWAGLQMDLGSVMHAKQAVGIRMSPSVELLFGRISFNDASYFSQALFFCKTFQRLTRPDLESHL